MREISGLAKFGYFCVGLFGGLFGVLAAWFMGKDGWGLERWRQAVCLVRLPVLAHRVGCHGRDGRHRGVSGHAVLTRSRQFGRFDRVTL